MSSQVFITPVGIFTLKDVEDGKGLCIRCAHRTLEFYDVDDNTVHELSEKPPIGVRCRSCDLKHQRQA